MSNVDIQFTDNTGEILNALDSNLDKTLEALGLQASGHAALNLERDPRRIDTGLLRNSITYAIAGEAPAKQNYKADNGDGAGQYQGKIAKATNEHSVYIGSNVQYAIYVHEGVHLPDGGYMQPNRFLRDAVTEHTDEYKKMIEKGLKGEL